MTPDDPLLVPVASDPLPAWLSDERLLRDEGVLFGLSDARSDEKTALIRSYFAQQTAGPERQIEQYNEKIGELNLFIGQCENELGELEHKQSTLLGRQPASHQLPRTIAGLLFAGGMVVNNYFLIQTALSPVFPEHTTLVALGIFLAGMFGLFNPTSLLHEPEGRPGIRRVLEEITLPLVAAGFVWMAALQHQPTGIASALGLFILGLFLFGGKLFLGLLTVLSHDLRAYVGNRQLLRDQRLLTAQYEALAAELRRNIDQFRAQKWQILPDLSRMEANRDRLNARRDTLVRLFESEFNLARSLKDRLTETQRQLILGDA